MAFEVTSDPGPQPGTGGGGYEKPPTGSLPFGKPGVLRPIGVGDLIVAREYILRYQGGELSHIENVLKSELRERETRGFERSEEPYSTETETSEEEERDTRSTDRFSLQREASSVVKEDSSLKAGLNVTARYGFGVEVKADVAVAQNRSEETSLKQASTVSRDVTSRAASRLTEKTKQAHIRKTIAEFEEFDQHAFDNKAGAAGIPSVRTTSCTWTPTRPSPTGRRPQLLTVLPTRQAPAPNGSAWPRKEGVGAGGTCTGATCTAATAC
ncbi:hypothetical protein ACFXG6_04230 [Streptomyces roseus]|uniref:hypothetical protein n=1 Tax=Streptomyces roseus TaxID=66430 RepID=UPI0036CEAC22